MKTRYIIAPIVMLAVLVVFSVPAMAQCYDPVSTNTAQGGGSGTVTDGEVFVKLGPGGEWTFEVPDGDVQWSRMSWHSWHDCPGQAEFCNGDGVCEQITVPTDCSQYPTYGRWYSDMGTNHYYWLVNATSGTNTFTPPSCDCRWEYFVAVIDNSINPVHNGYWWANIGLVKEIEHTTQFAGPINSSANYTLWTGQSHDENMEVYFNNHLAMSFPGTGWTGGLNKCNISKDWIGGSPQNMKWKNSDGEYEDFFPWIAVLVEQGPEPDRPDLNVTAKRIEHLNGSCLCQTPTAFVVNHTYDVEVEIKNKGTAPAGSGFNVTLYDGVNEVQTNRMEPLDIDESSSTIFLWNPTTSGTHTLRIMADSGYEVLESDETNNNLTQNEDVLAETGDPNPVPSAIAFSPAWQCNKTDIIVTVLNDVPKDADNFNLVLTMSNESGVIWTNTTTISVCAKAYKNFTIPSDPELINCSDYTVRAEISGNSIEEAFHAIAVRLKVTHHYGNTSDYNGVLSNYNTAKMVDIAKVVTNYTTVWQLLTSEVDVYEPADPVHRHYPYGINRSEAQGTSTWYMNESFSEDQTCPPGHYIIWYPYMNGIPMPTKDMPYEWGDHLLTNGDIIHMDINKWINPGNVTADPPYGRQFKARPVTDYPEPFKHGYRGETWSTIIVYPAGMSDYEALANKINDTLTAAGVAGVTVMNDTAINDTQKAEHHLILIGAPYNNSIIAEINGNHSEIGMVVYFNNLSDPVNVTMTDDWLYDEDKNISCGYATYDRGGVIEACDNPFNNEEPWTDTWRDTNQTIWIASGVDDAGAKAAAELLINHTDQFSKKRFWVYTISEKIYVGSNLISLPLVPENNSCASVLKSISEKYDIVFRLNASTQTFEKYVSPTFPFNDFDTMEPKTYAYDIKANRNCTLTLEGTIVQDNDPILFVGANWIGWPFMYEQCIVNATAPIIGKYDIIYRINASAQKFEKYVSPTYPFNDFHRFRPPLGYDIRANLNCNFTWPTPVPPPLPCPNP